MYTCIIPDKPFSFLDGPGPISTQKPLLSKTHQKSAENPKIPSLNNQSTPAAKVAIDWQQVGQSDSFYRLPALWEDVDPTGEEPAAVQCFGIITPEREREFRDRVTLNDQNSWKGPQQEMSFKYYRKSIDMMLMGIEGQVFVIDKRTGVFSVNNFNCTVDNVSGKISFTCREDLK